MLAPKCDQGDPKTEKSKMLVFFSTSSGSTMTLSNEETTVVEDEEEEEDDVEEAREGTLEIIWHRRCYSAKYSRNCVIGYPFVPEQTYL